MLRLSTPKYRNGLKPEGKIHKIIKNLEKIESKNNKVLNGLKNIKKKFGKTSLYTNPRAAFTIYKPSRGKSITPVV